MPDPLLVLRLEGPLQSWGERARWDVRDSLTEPTKSGVLGLLGAALGISRDARFELEELDRALRMGVRVEREGTLLNDFQTITGFLPTAEGKVKRSSAGGPATIISERRYLEDASFLVVFSVRARVQTMLLDQCAAALATPRWPLFLGRRACAPSRPILVGVRSDFASLEVALATYPWSCLGANGSVRPFNDVMSDETESRELRVVLEAADGTRTREDRILSNAARLYGRRSVREYSTPFPNQEVAA